MSRNAPNKDKDCIDLQFYHHRGGITMGYYVRTTDSNFCVPADKLDEAYKTLCRLNWRNDLKIGGIFPQIEGSSGEGPREDKWFSGMDWDYHETCPDARTILENLGFETELTKEGLYITYYDDKSGNEDVFIAALAPFVGDGSYIKWIGGNDYMYMWEVCDGVLYRRDATECWSDNRYVVAPRL